MRQLTTEAEVTAAAGGAPDAEAALIAVAALDPKTTGKAKRVCIAPGQAVSVSTRPGCRKAGQAAAPVVAAQGKLMWH